MAVLPHDGDHPLSAHQPRAHEREKAVQGAADDRWGLSRCECGERILHYCFRRVALAGVALKHKMGTEISEN